MKTMQRTALVLCAGLSFFSQPARAQDKTFQQPRIDDVRLDWCWSWKVKDCGKRVAESFCARRHYSEAKDFRQEKAGGHTRFIGSTESCDDAGCVGFAYITCSGPISGDARFKEFPNPPSPGGKFRLDRCREWGVNCGAPVAEAFCKRNGFATYKYFRTDSQEGSGPTQLIGTNQICNGRFCRGFQIIVCQK